MELVVEVGEKLFLNKVYAAFPHILQPYFQPQSLLRDSLTLWLISSLGGIILYFSIATFCYYVYFDKSLINHPKFLKNQIKMEITMALWQAFLGPLFMLPFWLPEINGYSKIYYSIQENGGWRQVALSIIFFLVFSDFCIYWIHRWFHHPKVYSWLHKPHHTWKISTPYSAFAFHPLDGFGQSLPYHVFPFIFPMQAHLFLIMFVSVQIWTFLIHDNLFLTKNSIINGAAHHAIHHLEFNYNYGQYFTFWDRVFNTHRFPSEVKKVDEYFEKAFDLKKTKNVTQTNEKVFDKKFNLKNGKNFMVDGEIGFYSKKLN
ncbi:Lathosterol oxidase [Lobulomyces angularis]|nr:Lathosterol oxidase [Lobulomyces angularis]